MQETGSRSAYAILNLKLSCDTVAMFKMLRITDDCLLVEDQFGLSSRAQPTPRLVGLVQYEHGCSISGAHSWSAVRTPDGVAKL